jgi:hypothetical protein
MSIKEDLHCLGDPLGDERAEALAYFRRLLPGDETPDAAALDQLDQRLGPRVISGCVFYSQPEADFRTLAAQQGVQPVTNFEDLLGDFWPDDETADQFIDAVRQWRREGGYA